MPTSIMTGRSIPADQTFFGNPNPKFTAGLNISVSYKNWDLYTFFYTSIGAKILNET
jgi:hypothetical protein